MPSTINQQEIDQFSQISDEWWNEKGPFKPLHDLNPIRLEFIKQRACDHFHIKKDFLPLKNLRVLDIGCGGGLVAEPLNRLGAEVTAIDPSPENIKIAHDHSQKMNLNISYKAMVAEQLTEHSFDIILALEVLEHVEDIDLFLKHCHRLLGRNGILILSTLNRTLMSFIQGIVMAEYILKWLPKGTHNWQLFIKPCELAYALEKSHLQLIELKGIHFQMMQKKWVLHSNIQTNYFAVATKSKLA